MPIILYACGTFFLLVALLLYPVLSDITRMSDLPGGKLLSWLTIGAYVLVGLIFIVFGWVIQTKNKLATGDQLQPASPEVLHRLEVKNPRDVDTWLRQWQQTETAHP